ncbi:helix-turn-helix transcriptional regulator [Chitinophaga costaii]|nr:helix-turn-helix domain-containing protein [Chitinophaga costaii]
MMTFEILDVPAKLIHVTPDVPKHYQSLLYPFAKATCTRSPGVDIIDQQIVIEGCTIASHTIIGKLDAVLHPVVVEPIATLHCMLQGNLACVLAPDMPVELVQGQFNFFEITPAPHRIFVKPGRYVSFHIDLSQHLLEKIAPAATALQTLLEKALQVESSPVLPDAGILLPEIYQEIEAIRQCPHKGVLAQIRLQGRILQLLTIVLESLYQPDKPVPRTQQLMATIKAYIDTHLDELLTLSRIAKGYALSESCIKQQFKALTGENFSEYLIRKRMEKARELLRTTNLPIGLIAFKVGYEEPTNFTREYKKYFHHLPSDERKMAV